MHFSHAILFLASALPAVVLADTTGSRIAVPIAAGPGNTKRSFSPLLRMLRRDDPQPASCTAPDDTPCLPKGVAPHTPHTCNIPLTNSPAYIGLDAVRRNGYPSCSSSNTCSCSAIGVPHDVLIEICREIISRQDPSLHVVDACASGPTGEDGHCDLAGPTYPDFSGTDVTVYNGWVCKNGKYVGEHTPSGPPS
ncbi:unnamed protein product [Zymoseptoria tritici ST99CH_1A5]|uniref:Uncharacterized protein n=4 Tax=Zymoseptoria tritici TaxID=1047171 RepID=F9XB95_ZYMTI|nr:uncharacterized protein MYCGRDRAFT_93075 [Zymoseptoria tritici IPO323]SMQ50641.1 unnamed protein product [Zymoseptoria tritici ST99CH_3D7]SMR52502.1 unnamed protein product [Zymoseptoria tritici ST99CH_1E4]SMR53701.1 unnamed protein product [Zymoseptoria tritici ST99CH_3D1]SMY24318.1 unnamed protein product [Zymoseptoria tritici ST99CH_1A5]EGP87080.1 hypothetical protein MYCGRDRAFT_93075 [Zymoseptoria tritici IPO323]